MNQFYKNLALWLVISLVMIMLFNMMTQQGRELKPVPYTTFLAALDESEVVDVTIKGSNIEGTYKDGSAFKTYAPDDPDLISMLRKQGVAIKAEPDESNSFWMSVLVSWGPILLLIAVWIFFMRQMQSGGGKAMSFGKSRAKLLSESQAKITFNDVAGIDEAKDELEEVVSFLKDPKKFSRLGGRIPKGVLLVGPPGTGKTLLGRAIAGEAGVPFMSISGSDFVEMFVGVGAARVRDLFDQAKQTAPAIVFIDEIDAVGRHRGAGLGGGHDEREQTLNQLLVELDGFEGNTGVIVMAATNRPDILDPALLRPGRFDRQITIDSPDIKGRTAILEVHSKGKPLGKDVKLKTLAQRTPGFTGADLANLINEAALLAARRRKGTITMDEMEEAIDRVIAGPERRTRVITDEEKKVTAYHEAGHALVGFALPNSNPIHKVTIIPRGRAGGYTLSLPTEDRMYQKRSEMVDRLAMSLGGRTAEEVVFKDPTTGAGNDIEVATQLARQMVMVYGMSDKLGPMAYGRPGGEVFLGRDYNRQQDYSDEVAAWIDGEVRHLLEAAHEEARLIIETHMESLERLVAALLEKETVDRDEVADLLYDVPKWEHTEEGSLRIKYPDDPVLPQPRVEVAAAVETEDEPDELTKSLELDRKLPRTKGRPAEA